MATKNNLGLDLVVGVVTLASAGCAFLLDQVFMAGGAVLGGVLCFSALRLLRPSRPTVQQEVKPESLPKATPAVKPTPRKSRDGDDSNNLIEEMLDQGRFTLLLRPQIVENLRQDQLARAVKALEESMALVPEGDVLMYPQFEHPSQRGEIEPCKVRVEAIYLDRYPVTNTQYYEFVSTGGYEQITLWDPEILPGLLDFVDRSGIAGPRFWQDGIYMDGSENHPVVGISWYEASAFARWIGKRMPTDPEWVKAGCWPVTAVGDKPVQRKFPWGDAMDRKCANLWKSGTGHIVSVEQYDEGMSVGGVYQLIGNVWEWTQSNYGAWDDLAKELQFDHPVKSIRGGAFDTYFDNQATCQFQSGDSSILGKHNIGFRCALGVCDLAIPDDFDDEITSQGSTSHENESQESENLASNGTVTAGESS